MEISQEELKKLVIESVEEAMEKKYGPLWVSAQKHYDDHHRLDYCAAHWDEMQENHRYIKNLRETSGLVKKWAGKAAIGTAILGFSTWFFMTVFGIKL